MLSHCKTKYPTHTPRCPPPHSPTPTHLHHYLHSTKTIISIEKQYLNKRIPNRMRVYAANKIKKKIKKRCCLHNITGRAHRCASSHPHVPFFFAFDQPASPPDAFIETLEQHVIYQTRNSNYGKKRGELISTYDGRLKSLITALCTHLINPCRQLAPNRRSAHEIESKSYWSRKEK